MAVPDKSLLDLLLGLLKSLVPWRSEPANVSRDFWMPDESCRVCYECDSQFTVLNRRHHCRHCGRIFCGKCTANRVPAPSSEPWDLLEERKKIRVCNFCFKQWEQGLDTVDDGNSETQVADLDISCSLSGTSFVSPKSSVTVSSSCIVVGSVPSAVRFYQRSNSCILSPRTSAAMERNEGEQGVPASENIVDTRSPNQQFLFRTNRSGDDDEFQAYQLDSKTGYFPQVNGYFGQEFDESSSGYESNKVHRDGETIDTKSISSSSLQNSFCSGGSEQIQHLVKKEDEHDMGDECEAPSSSSIYDPLDVDVEPVDFENNGLLWLPPEPEDEEDEREALLFDDEGDASGEWGYLRSSSSFNSGEHQTREKANEEHKNAMKNVVDGHFRALVAQLLQVENLPFGEEDDKENWLEIVTSLSWEAATLLKPDMSKGGGMDPGGYVKVKCLASGQRSESMVIKGVVCKKNVAHRRMTSKIEKPRLLMLGGALEYQRVSNLLSSFDTLLQQEMDHLKMAVAKIDVHQPDVLLVEKSVSRFAQEYLLAKDISLVLNVKKPLLERIARCTGGQIVPSIDHLSSPNLGYCDMFHVDRCLEEHGTAGQGGKKLVKTLMYFEGCPKPLGCTILLRGASGDDLKKVKHVVQYSIFAAYHLALETSFLADEGASLPELPLNSPITVAFPDKSSNIDRSISMIPGFIASASETSKGPELCLEPQRSISLPASDLSLPIPGDSFSKIDAALQQDSLMDARSESLETKDSDMVPESKVYAANSNQDVTSDELIANDLWLPETEGQGVHGDNAQTVYRVPSENHIGNSEISSTQKDVKLQEEPASSKEEFPPSPSDHQSILVSLSSRCVWKGTVCERSHLFRIKYYGNFDKPLGRFLRDHLFDQSYRCPSCDMPSEAHVHCYTHRQGTLTISVKKLPEFLLPGERDGKIWMWHRCLRCPRNKGFPPATRRVVMSDAAWGLSLGKFLELSFSNHAAASRVASCGHSLHRDCLRFYGFGKMVACFRYASIDVHSVYLPPHKLDFNHENVDWIQKEITEVNDRADLLFSEILNALGEMKDKRCGSGVCNSGRNLPHSRCQVTELEVMLQNEKVEFKELVQKILNKEVIKGQLVGDILEINRLRRQLLFQSYMWDHRLIYAASLDHNSVQDETSSTLEVVENPVSENNHLINMSDPVNQGQDLNSSDSGLVDVKLKEDNGQGGTIGSNSNQPEVDHQRIVMEVDSTIKKEKGLLSVSSVEIRVESDLPKPDTVVRRTASESQVSVVSCLSDTLDAAWTGETHPEPGVPKPEICAESVIADSSNEVAEARSTKLEDPADDHNTSKVSKPSSLLSSKGHENTEDSISWLGMPFLNFYRSWNKNFVGNAQKLDTLGEYNPVYVSSFRELELLGGARLLLPVGVNDTVIPVYDDEPTSIVAYALVSPEYLARVSDEYEKPGESFLSVDSGNLQSFQSFDETALESCKSVGSADDSYLSMPGSRSSSILDPLSYTKALHARVSFTDDGPLGKVKYSVTCYYAKRFEALRRICCPSEMDFIRSLSRCKKWGAQGGKSNVFFAKTLDDRFIIKQVTKTELESFIKFAPEYFKYLSESIGTGSPTCLAKILGIYQVTSKHLKGGKDTKMDILVMENLLYGRNVIRLYDLKGSSRSRYNPDSSGSNKVLLDQNLIEAMPTSPIFVGNKAKRLLERAVWNDTSFLASVDVMDYSLLVGVDQDKHELVLGIIDFMRQYTWDKHLETWVKASGILGGPKNASPTVISPKQYKKRFRKAMTTYFLMLPDQWSPPTNDPSKSQTEISEEKTETTETATD